MLRRRTGGGLALAGAIAAVLAAGLALALLALITSVRPAARTAAIAPASARPPPVRLRSMAPRIRSTEWY